MYLLRALIGSLDCLRLLWLVRVITLVLVSRHSNENRSISDSIIILNKALDLWNRMICVWRERNSEKTIWIPDGIELAIFRTLIGCSNGATGNSSGEQRSIASRKSRYVNEDTYLVSRSSTVSFSHVQARVRIMNCFTQLRRINSQSN